MNVMNDSKPNGGTIVRTSIAAQRSFFLDDSLFWGSAYLIVEFLFSWFVAGAVCAWLSQP